MQKLEAAVIHMQQIFEDITFLFSNFERLEKVSIEKPELIFSDDSVNFLNLISADLLKNSSIRQYPDVLTFAFFCRKANILKLKQNYLSDTINIGRGVIFHIAPSNVPVNFAYSMVVGILSGNSNIVKVPSKEYFQVKLICDSINNVVSKNSFEKIYNNLFIIKYNKQDNITDYLSNLADIRIIWGGDKTIAHIRQSSIPARSFDVTFADRYSFAIINADEYVNAKDLNKITHDFYNDTYLFDQNACTAPHLVIWIGKNENVKNARKLFWDLLDQSLINYPLQEDIAINKLNALIKQGIEIGNITREQPHNNKLWRVLISELNSDLDHYRCAGGFFHEYISSSFNDIEKIVNRKYQTLSYYGFEKKYLKEKIRELKLNGIDRVVPIGSTTNFDLHWDGYDLIHTLSRICKII